jgi:hypothetical protein
MQLFSGLAVSTNTSLKATHLSFHYFTIDRKSENEYKSLILIGSMGNITFVTLSIVFKYLFPLSLVGWYAGRPIVVGAKPCFRVFTLMEIQFRLKTCNFRTDAIRISSFRTSRDENCMYSPFFRGSALCFCFPFATNKPDNMKQIQQSSQWPRNFFWLEYHLPPSHELQEQFSTPPLTQIMTPMAAHGSYLIMVQFTDWIEKNSRRVCIK